MTAVGHGNETHRPSQVEAPIPCQLVDVMPTRMSEFVAFDRGNGTSSVLPGIKQKVM